VQAADTPSPYHDEEASTNRVAGFDFFWDVKVISLDYLDGCFLL